MASRDERGDLARLCLGSAGIASFVGGSVAIGIAGLEARTFAPVVLAGLALYAVSLLRAWRS